jgi:cytosine/adenosine deaminase-related metal-dependent hydrolase
MSESNRRTFLSWISKSGLALATVGIAGAGRTTAAADPSDILVFTNATLIDGTGAGPRPNTTIVVIGDRIVAVGRHRSAPPAGVRVVDLRGKYVLPGLWDMHSHTFALERILPPLFIVNGVTRVREMWGLPFVRAVRDRIESGEVVGPRMVVASNIVDGPNSMLTPFGDPTEVTTVAEARAAVRQAKRDGADFVKVYSFLRDNTFTAVADEARRVGLRIAGHVPDRISVVRGSDLGMRTQEHLYALYVDVSTERDRIRHIIRTTPVDPAQPVNWFFMVRELEREAIKHYDPRRAAKVFAGLVRNRTALTPTLTVLRLFTSPPEELRDDPRVKYLPAWVRQNWEMGLGPPWTPEQIAAGREFFDASAALLRDAAAAGVSMVAGTDGGVSAPFIFPGFGLHDELELMVRVGLTPMQAILAATRDAARFAGQRHLSGTVAPGKAADLLVLDDDPLADIRNTQHIHGIVANGRFIDRAERERMLADIEEEAANTPPPDTVALAPCCAHLRRTS